MSSGPTGDPGILREQAEGRVAQQHVGELASLSAEEARETLLELRVHQAELQIQNEELHRLQAELSASRERYFDLYNLAPVGYFTLDKKGVIQEANLTAAQLLSMERRMLSGQRLARFVSPDHMGHLADFLDRIFSGTTQEVVTLQMRSRDREEFWARLEGILADEEGLVRQVCRLVLSDVSAQVLAEKELQKTQELFRAFMLNLPGLAFIKDRKGRILYRTEGIDPLLGVSGEALEKMREEDRRVLATGIPVTREYKISAPEGHWMLTRFRIRNPEEEGDFLGGVAVDITPRVQAEERLAAALKQEVVLRREIHHRVKNSLQVVISLLFIQSQNTADPVALEILRECQSRTQAISLIYELLSGAENISKILFAAYARQLASNLLAVYHGKRRNVRLVFRAEGILCDIDTALPCGLILSELVSNSLKHAFPDERNGEIRIQLNLIEDRWMELAVSDNGVGPPEGMDLEKAQTVGLSLVRDLTRQLGGNLQFETGSGTGISVTIRWPRGTESVE